MPTDIEFTNILNKEKDNASCNLLRVGDIKILLDCGCDERLKDSQMSNPASALSRVKAAAEEVHFVFISHATIQQVGALPYLHRMKSLQNVQSILSTSPVAKMGAQTMYEFTI